ncbi:MAG: hypothetical protein V4492_02570, partial [Chlamydiota bacterium]
AMASLLIPSDQSITGSMLAGMSFSSMQGTGLITKDTLKVRFTMKITQLQRTKAFVEQIVKQSDLGRFGSLSRMNGHN